jgi:hypothetical protein
VPEKRKFLGMLGALCLMSAHACACFRLYYFASAMSRRTQVKRAEVSLQTTFSASTQPTQRATATFVFTFATHVGVKRRGCLCLTLLRASSFQFLLKQNIHP